MAEKRRSTDLAARAYVSIVIVLGGIVLAWSAVDSLQHPVSLSWLLLVALTILGGWATLRIPAMPISFSISDTFIMSAALLFGPSAGALTAAIDAFVLSCRMEISGHTLHRLLFNMATAATAAWLAAQMFFALAGSQPVLEGPSAALRLLVVLLLYGAVNFGLNTGLVAAAVAFERALPIRAVWREHFLGLWVSYFGGAFGAMLLLVLARLNRYEMLLLVVPVPGILYMTFRHALGRASDQIDHLAKVNRVYVGAIEALAHAVDAKDDVTHDHTRRVQDRAVGLARALGVEAETEIQAIKAASLLHDVGKLAIPEHILNKPGRLTPAEYEIMKRHAGIGADILSVVGFPFAVAPIVRCHHENWDGSGYPEGISGEEIPIGARILAVVDCFDALTSDRPYRPRLSDEDALLVLQQRRGNMYDPRVVDAFFEYVGAVDVSAAGTVDVVRPTTPSAIQAALPSGDDHAEDVSPQALFALGQAIGEPRNFAELGNAVSCHLRSLIPASTVAIYLYNQADDSITTTYRAGEERDSISTDRIALGERLSGWVAATGQAAVNSDARLDLDEDARVRSRLRSALVAPLVDGDRVVGVLSLYSDQASPFDEVHRRLVVAVGLALGSSIARLSAPDLVAR